MIKNLMDLMQKGNYNQNKHYLKIINKHKIKLPQILMCLNPFNQSYNWTLTLKNWLKKEDICKHNQKPHNKINAQI